ncbi:MAG: hypothetical protein R3E79_47140 [Caldilineaceae bacterium]
MNRLSMCYAKPIVTKVFSGLIVIALVLGYLPQGVARATSSATAPNAACERPTAGGGNTLFLPLIQNADPSLIASSFQDTSGSGAVPREIRYEVGKTYVYEWNLNVTSQTISRDAEGTHDDGTNLTVVRAWADILITAKSDDGVYDGQVLLRNPFICNKNHAEELVVNDMDIIQALQVPIRFQQTSKGIITTVSVPSDAPAQITNLQKGILNALQLTLQDGVTTYEAEEQGTQGTYKAAYTIEEDGSDLHIAKRFNLADFNTVIQK